jgi:hypothetical protein
MLLKARKMAFTNRNISGRYQNTKKKNNNTCERIVLKKIIIIRHAVCPPFNK